MLVCGNNISIIFLCKTEIPEDVMTSCAVTQFFGNTVLLFDV